MKLVKLKMAAFGPYGGVEEINFSKFYGENLFLITGNTGAGKTTIFDAICFALYGGTCGQKKDIKTLRSSFAKANQLSFVEFEFESNGKIYMIRREPEQMVARASGEGFKQKKHSAQLFMPDGMVKTNLKEIANLIVNQLVGFDMASFNKVAMLPQGQFQKLLSERGEQQLKTFRSIFETEFYEQIANGLFDFKQNIVKNFELFEQQNSKTIDLIVCDDFEFLKMKLNSFVNFKQIVRFLEQKNRSDSLKLVNYGLVLQKIEDSMQELESKLQLFDLCAKKRARFEQIRVELEALVKKKPSSCEICKHEKLIKKIESLQFLKSSVDDLKTEALKKQKQLEELKNSFNCASKNLKLACEEFGKVSQIENCLVKLQAEINDLQICEQSVKLVSDMDLEIDGFKNKLEIINMDLKKAQACQLILKLKLEIEKASELAQNLKILINSHLKKQHLEKKLLELRRNYNNIFSDFLAQQASSLALSLKKGEPCPVCGSKVHPKKNFELTNLKSHILNQNDVENCRLEILEFEKKLQTLLNDEGALFANLKVGFELDFKSFSLAELKEQLKNCSIRINELKLDFKKQVPRNFWKLNPIPNFNYEIEIEKLKGLRAKNLASIVLLSKNKGELINKIPENLQKNLSSISSMKNDRVLKQAELNKQKNDLFAKKIDAEKTYEIVKTKIASYELNYVEVLNKEKDVSKKLELELKKNNFSAEEFMNYSENFENIKKFVETSKNILHRIEILEIEKKSLSVDLEKIEKLDKAKLDKLKLKKNRLKKLIKSLELILINRLAVNENCLKTLKSAEIEMNSLNENFSAAKTLAEVAKGTRKRIGFERYVLCSFINEVLAFASTYFKKSTAGRYVFSKLVFQNLSGLNFSVLDVYSGQVRDVSTLSGGETFMASLALCLGLRDVVSNKLGGNTLNTMLIDEGFGTLDEHYLDSVIDCLKLLSGSESLIGIISHVNVLKHKIKAQIQVKQKLGEAGGAYCLCKLD